MVNYSALTDVFLRSFIYFTCPSIFKACTGLSQINSNSPLPGTPPVQVLAKVLCVQYQTALILKMARAGHEYREFTVENSSFVMGGMKPILLHKISNWCVPLWSMLANSSDREDRPPQQQQHLQWDVLTTSFQRPMECEYNKHYRYTKPSAIHVAHNTNIIL